MAYLSHIYIRMPPFKFRLVIGEVIRGGAPLRIPFRVQILTLLADGEKRTAELVASIEGHPKAVKNELKRLVDAGEIVRVRWGLYALPLV